MSEKYLSEKTISFSYSWNVDSNKKTWKIIALILACQDIGSVFLLQENFLSIKTLSGIVRSKERNTRSKLIVNNGPGFLIGWLPVPAYLNI